MKKRWICVLLFLAVLVGMVPVGTEVYAGNSQPKILYIPVDDRPYNQDRAVLLAESMELELIMPQQDLYATRLDGQSLNSNGTQYGDRGRLFEFLQANANQADIFVLSLDQLLSGGLMNSRCMEELTPIRLSNGSTITEHEVIDYIVELAQSKPVYIIDSIPRLASSNEFGGYDLVDYTLTRRYGMVGRPILTGADITLENVIANYPLGEDGTEALYQGGFSQKELAYFTGQAEYETSSVIEQELLTAVSREEDFQGDVFRGARAVTPVSLMAEGGEPEGQENQGTQDPKGTEDNSLRGAYLRVRERKLRLLDYALRALSGKENVYYLLGVDDSASGNSIHTNEIAYAKTLMHENDVIFSAMDGLAQTALTQLYRNCTQQKRIRYAVSYYGDSKETVGDYNYMTISDMVQESILYHGGVLVSEQPDVSVLVYTTSEVADRRNRNMLELISKINENELNQIPTILLDLSEQEVGQLNALYGESIHTSMLLSFSGKAEGPVLINMGISQGTGRYLYLKSTARPTEQAQTSYLKTLLWSLMEEYYQTTDAKKTMESYLKSLGYSASFGTASTEQLEAIEQRLTQTVCEYAGEMLQSFADSNFIASLQPYSLGAVTSVDVEDCRYPWLRPFEIAVTLRCTVDQQPRNTTIHTRYANGMTIDTFEPDGCLTREQAAKLLVLAGGKTVDQNALGNFTDVSFWARPYVAVASNAGYIKGYPDKTFKGTQNITRAEFSALVLQYSQAENKELVKKKTMAFTDVARDSSDWYAEAVYLLADAGIIQGYEDGTFQPDNEITRAEAITMLNRVFDRTETLPEGLLKIQRYKDVTPGGWYYQVIQEASVSHTAS